MTENYPPAAPQWTEPLPPAQEQQGTTDVIKEQAADLGGSTVQAGKHTAGVAREQASNVVEEASRQGRDLLQQAQGQLGEQVAQGQQRLASELLSLSDELHSMAESSGQSGTASELARQAASRARDAGQWLDARGPAEVVNEVQSFARRRPGAFLAIAVGAGLIAGRLTRGIKAASSEDSSPAQLTGDASYPPVSVPQTAPQFSAPATDLPAPAREDSSWAVEETYVEQTYVQPEPLVPGDQAGPEDGR